MNALDIHEIGFLMWILIVLIVACCAVMGIVEWNMKRQARRDKEAMRRHVQGEYPKWM